MQVKSIAECSKGEHSAILSTFIRLPSVIKTFVLSFFEWSFYTGFTVLILWVRLSRTNDVNVTGRLNRVVAVVFFEEEFSYYVIVKTKSEALSDAGLD